MRPVLVAPYYTWEGGVFLHHSGNTKGSWLLVFDRIGWKGFRWFVEVTVRGSNDCRRVSGVMRARTSWLCLVALGEGVKTFPHLSESSYRGSMGHGGGGVIQPTPSPNLPDAGELPATWG